MATQNRNRRRKSGGRKLEIAIYIAGALVVALVVFGIVRGIGALIGGEEETPENSVVSTMTEGSQEQSQIESSHSVEQSQEESSQSMESVSSDDYVVYTKSGVDELNEWYLFLVNPQKSVSSDWIANMTYVDSEYQLDSRIVDAYQDMISAADSDGVTLYPVSCYRPYSTQQRLYNNRVERAKNENPSFTQAQAEAYAATFVARPGTSEHQTGLAIDFNSVETDFGSTDAGRWLKENANDYGFILRYEQDKQPITGVTWEPWHYRFVGVKHAKRMTELGYCLEEYIDHIRNGGQ